MMPITAIYMSLLISTVEITNVDHGSPDVGRHSVTNLSFLTGDWIGTGRPGDDGEIEGTARIHWTAPIDGVSSYLFTWNVPETGHVHYALTVFRDEENSVYGKGLHFGRELENFEEYPWELHLIEVAPEYALFACENHCQASSVRFSILEDGRLEERWRHDVPDQPDWVVTYRAATALDQ
jgi:hypothetical protein